MIAPLASPAAPIALVTSSLGGGGAERLVAVLARHWSSQGREVHVFALRSQDPSHDFPLPPAVRVHSLALIRERNPVGEIRGNVARLRALRAALRAVQPGCVVSFIDKLNIAVLLALARTDMPVIATEHVVPWLEPIGPFWSALRWAVYRRAAAVVCPNQEIADWLQTRLPRLRSVVLPYPAPPLTAIPATAPARRNEILSAGRLAPVKAHGLLIAAFARVAAEYPEWRLVIAGEGPLRSELTGQISRLGLSGRVDLPGFLPDLDRRMAEAAIFALSSRSESFSLVLVEAMRAGMAVVSTDCPTGPRAILRPDTDGLLVPNGDGDALAVALARLMADPALRRGLGESAAQHARRFSPEAALPAWDALIQSIESHACRSTT